MTNIKISTKDHLPNRSSQSNNPSRRDTEVIFGGANHKKKTTNCFVYGHAPEKRAISIANSVAPASHMSTTDSAMLKTNNSLILIASPPICASMSTEAPSEIWPLKKKPIFAIMDMGIKYRMKPGMIELLNIEVVFAFIRNALTCSSRCFPLYSITSRSLRLPSHFLCLFHFTICTTDVETAAISNTETITDPIAIMKSQFVGFDSFNCCNSWY
mmetsp:Transcript_16908/g.25378  ORF Transcript_16908/g.25378 Transcript_16908/m.25378 type:complete len:214 (-) Transcript_16908:756-1397(-)